MSKSCFLVSMMKLFLFRVFLLNFIHSISPSLAITNISTDQSALLALKAHITHDPQNLLATNWSTSTSVCNWVGVTCGLRQHRVTVLNVSYFGLTGTIPPHLGNLSFLTQLSLRYNSFYGSLPIELTHLRRIKLIDFRYNNFTGEIPSWLGSFSKLQFLHLGGNQFSGTIPKEIGNATMLKILHLYENHLSGEIPQEIGNIELEALQVHSNTLTGTIPSFIFNISHLRILTLSNNYVSGMLPDNMCHTLPNLEELYLKNCNLRGRIPSQLSQCGKLRIFQLAGNNLTGSISSILFNMSHLEMFSLSENNFERTVLPENICHNLPNLKELHMSGINLGGRIPSQWSQCGKLRVISLAFNNLVGSIPQTVGNLTNLEELYLTNNSLTEYGIEGVVSTRGDVYSYGILLMETFTGKKPTDAMFVGEFSLKKWVEDAFTHYDVTDVADTSVLEGENILLLKECLSSIFQLALCCTIESPTERKSMKEISTQLSKVKLKFSEGV